MNRTLHLCLAFALALFGLASVPGQATAAGKGADRLVPSRVEISSADDALGVRVGFRVTNRGESPGRRAEPRTVRVKLLGPEGSRHRLGRAEVGPLKAGKSVRRSVRSRLPAAAAPGEYHARVCVRSSGKQRCRTSRSSIVITLPALEITPTGHEFGDVLVGETSGFETFTVTNTGGLATGALETGLAGARPDEFVLGGPDSCTGRPLAGGTSCTVNVAYSPTEDGAAAASLEVTGSPGVAAAATLAGAGLAPAELEISPASHVFGHTVTGSTSTVREFTVTNVGDVATGELSSILSTAIPGAFRIESDRCTGSTLDPDGSCTVGAVFTAKAIGVTGGSLEVGGSPGGTAVTSLFGTGVLPAALTITPADHDFGGVLIGEDAGVQTFTVTNTGGVATGTLTTDLIGPDAAEFAHGTDTCYGVALAPSQSCSVSVDYSPTARGLTSASLEVAGTPGGAAYVNLTGTGLAPAEFDITGDPDFGNVVVPMSSDFRTFTFTNVGDVPTGSPTVVIEADGDVRFGWSHNTCTESVAPGDSCTMQVGFFAAAAGPVPPTTLRAFAAAPTVSDSMTLTGNGVSTGADLDWDTDTVVSDPEAVGEHSWPITLSNTGGADAHNLVFAIQGPLPGHVASVEFVPGAIGPIPACGATLVGGARCAGRIVYTLTAAATGVFEFTVTGSPGGTAVFTRVFSSGG